MEDIGKLVSDFMAKKAEVETLKAASEDATRAARDAKVIFDKGAAELNKIRHDIIEATSKL